MIRDADLISEKLIRIRLNVFCKQKNKNKINLCVYFKLGLLLLQITEFIKLLSLFCFSLITYIVFRQCASYISCRKLFAFVIVLTCFSKCLILKLISYISPYLDMTYVHCTTHNPNDQKVRVLIKSKAVQTMIHPDPL